MKEVKLQFGSGYKYKKGFVNIDLLPETNPDIVMDLDKERLPFSDESVDFITSEFLFEHLRNFEFVLRECHRVMKKGSSMYMMLPYATGISGDYEYHIIRPRYWVFADFDKANNNRMVEANPTWKIDRRLIFPRWCSFMNLLNKDVRLIDAYERTGLRYIIPAIELELIFTKE